MLKALKYKSTSKKFQFVFCGQHSTDMAILRVLTDIFFQLDLDAVDHRILQKRLSTWVGISAKAPDWFKSYLSDRPFSITDGSNSILTGELTFGVPQGSILGPILFALYVLPLDFLI